MTLPSILVLYPTSACVEFTVVSVEGPLSFLEANESGKAVQANL